MTIRLSGCRNKFLLLPAMMIIISCTHGVSDSGDFVEAVTGSGAVTLAGWTLVKGEIMLYPDRKSMNEKAKFPRCISGVFANHYDKSWKQFDKRKVSITGDLIPYSLLVDELDKKMESLPEIEGREWIRPHAVMLANSDLLNFCFGENVLLLKEISFAN